MTRANCAAGMRSRIQTSSLFEIRIKKYASVAAQPDAVVPALSRDP
jgi:hypothetical protein